jgi:hypothetical protein
VSAHDAAPGAVAAPGHGLTSTVGARSIPELPPAILGQLAAEGIRTLGEWRKLTHRQKHAIFGITAAMVRQLDALARTACAS